LSKAPDALEIDTTGISPEEVVRIIMDSIKNRKTVGAAK
jgi:cytidylate kinase